MWRRNASYILLSQNRKSHLHLTFTSTSLWRQLAFRPSVWWMERWPKQFREFLFLRSLCMHYKSKRFAAVHCALCSNSWTRGISFFPSVSCEGRICLFICVCISSSLHMSISVFFREEWEKIAWVPTLWLHDTRRQWNRRKKEEEEDDSVNNLPLCVHSVCRSFFFSSELLENWCLISLLVPACVCFPSCCMLLLLLFLSIYWSRKVGHRMVRSAGSWRQSVREGVVACVCLVWRKRTSVTCSKNRNSNFTPQIICSPLSSSLFLCGSPSRTLLCTKCTRLSLFQREIDPEREQQTDSCLFFPIHCLFIFNCMLLRMQSMRNIAYQFVSIRHT